MVSFDSGPKFPLGEVHLTSGAIAKLSPEDIADAIRRHGHGDWGDVGLGGQEDNDRRVAHGGTIASIYTSATGIRFHVLTEPDRSVTTLLLPEEY